MLHQLVASNQQITHDWWDHRREHFEVYSSQLVIREARLGDPEFSILPAKAGDDALHTNVGSIFCIVAPG